MPLHKDQCFDELRGTLREVLQRQVAGRQPRNNSGHRLMAEQIATGVTMGQQATMAAAMQTLGVYELAWRLRTPRARAAMRSRVHSLLVARIKSRRLHGLMADAAAQRRQFAERYRSLGGKARKRFRRRHRDKLHAVGAICSPSLPPNGVTWSELSKAANTSPLAV